MTEVDIDPSPEFVQGFNEAYTIAKSNPSLAAQLTKAITGTSERLDGFKKGYDQYVLETDKQFTLSFLQAPDKDEPGREDISKDDLAYEKE